MALLSYGEVSAILYRSSDIGIRLTKEAQSVLVQAIALFNSPDLWSDYDTYGDEIDALVSASELALLIPESYPVNMQTSFLLSCLHAYRGVNDAGNAVALFNNGNAYAGFYAMQNTPALNDQFHYQIHIDAGDYVIRHVYHKSSLSGVVSISLLNVNDASVVNTTITALSTYAAVETWNNIQEGTFTIPDGGGVYNLCFTVTAIGIAGGSYRHRHSQTYVWKQDGTQ